MKCDHLILMTILVPDKQMWSSHALQCVHTTGDDILYVDVSYVCLQRLQCCSWRHDVAIVAYWYYDSLLVYRIFRYAADPIASM